ncbi:MAG: DEAD/DEAH box helicase, partial [Candidatus Thalassarchaeaceae archaeon]|nr:DEAD/DEAH box helicase [Candidatus Thalassarchaeaceae archaeon]
MNEPFRTRTREEANLLLRIHQFEESRVAGPGSSKRDIRDVLWTVDEVGDSLCLDDTESAALLSLIAHMQSSNFIMIFPSFKDNASGHLTRTAETIRLLGFDYEYWHQGRPGADAIRWLPVPKEIPDRNISCKEFIQRIENDLSEIVPLYGSDLETAITEVVEGISRQLGGKDGIEGAKYSEFQYRSTIEMLQTSLSNHSSSTQVLSAGVGSGKTIGFLMPTLILARLSELRGIWEVDLVLYPRTALALDQFDTLKTYADCAELDTTAVHSEMSQFYDKELKTSVKRGVATTHNGAGGPLIVVCTMETLKRRLQNPDFVRGMMPRLRRVIIDEVHLVNGSTGAHVATLMRRLRELAGRDDLQWAASSATIASPEEHASRLFDVDPRTVEIIRPEDDELVLDGIQNHVFVRPSGRISTMGLLVNMTSLVLHSMRDDLAEKPSTDYQIENSPKTIGFADNLDVLGRWNNDLMENERTENRSRDDGYLRPHPLHEAPVSTGQHNWTRQQRELPYASRFVNPLDRRISCEGGVLPTDEGGGAALLRVLENQRGEDLCGKCRQGTRVSLGPADEQLMHELGKLIHRHEHDQGDPFKPFFVNNQVFREEQEEIGNMDLCPYLRSGSCIWFSKSDPGATSMIPGTNNNPRYEYSSVATTSIYSSKSERTGEEDGLSAMVFKDTLENVYQLPGRNRKVPIDMVLASPSLEVGIDLPYLTESVMVNAIRNIASYRQKAGRVGRETNLDTLNATLVTDSPVDLHYYRQPRKLVSEGRLEPVPLKERNRSIVLCGLYQSVWDWLALNSSLPEVIPTDWEVPFTISKFRRKLETCLEDMEENSNRIASHLSAVCGGMYLPNSSEILEAIAQVKDEIGAFLRPALGTKVFARPLSGDYTVADVLSRMLSSNDTAETPNTIRRAVSMFISGRDNDWNNLQTSRRDLASLEGRNRIDSTAIAELDRLFSCNVPDLASLNRIKEKLEANLEALQSGGPSHRKMERFLDNFNRIYDNLDELVTDDGWDPLAHQIITEFDAIGEDAGWKKTY